MNKAKAKARAIAAVKAAKASKGYEGYSVRGSSVSFLYSFPNKTHRILPRSACYAVMRSSIRPKICVNQSYSMYFTNNAGQDHKYKRRLEFITDLISEQSLLYDSVIKHNLSMEIAIDDEIIEINTPEFITKYGFVLYNTDKTKAPALMVFLGYLRYIHERPDCITNYFLFKDRGLGIRSCMLLCNIPLLINANKSLKLRYNPSNHTALELSPSDFKYFMKAGIGAMPSIPYMTFKPGYSATWSPHLDRKPDVDIFQYALDNKDPEDLLKYGSYGKASLGVVHTEFFRYNNKAVVAKEHDILINNVRKNRSNYIFRFHDLCGFMADVMKERFPDDNKIQCDNDVTKQRSA